MAIDLEEDVNSVETVARRGGGSRGGVLVLAVLCAVGAKPKPDNKLVMAPPAALPL